MTILVAYASKHGSTASIAERIGDTLRARGYAADVKPIGDVDDLSPYAASVIGGAVYFGSWLKDLTKFIDRHQLTLAEHPVWLFSSGPLGNETSDVQGCDVRESSVPKEVDSVASTVHARDHRVFFGALDHTTFNVCERLLWTLPPTHSLLVEGDFRDWPDVESWAMGIANQLDHEHIDVYAQLDQAR
ncbi:MAG TPA: flavodoxin domain-containing protein [Chloroflexota bacterium]